MGSSLPQQAERILRWLTAHGIIVDAASRVRIPAGTINTVVRAREPGGGVVYVRIGPPEREGAGAPSWMRHDALASEATVLARVRRSVPCVPVPVAAGFRSDAGHWLVQEGIPGRPLGAVVSGMPAGAWTSIWRQLGELIRRIHAVDGPWFGTPDGRQRFATWGAMVAADAEGLLDDARRFGLDPAPYERLRADVARHRDALDAVERPAVVHSDLDPRHIFVARRGEEWAITGLIDWEYARFADPCSESLLVDLLHRPASDLDREAFLGGYGFDASMLADSAFQARQAIYRGIIAGWAETDIARLALAEGERSESLPSRNRPVGDVG